MKASGLAPLRQRWNSIPKLILKVPAASVGFTALATLPVLGGLGVSYVLGPHQFTKRVDRSTTRFPDPVDGLHHMHQAVNDIKLHIVTNSDRPRDRLILFLHGYPEFWYSWRNQLKEFKTDHHVAAVDMRGFGDSEKPQLVSSYTIDKLAADVKGVVEALGHRSCVLVGHDWGGVVAQATAYQYPALVEKLVVMGTFHLRLLRENLDWEQLRRSAYVWCFQVPGLPELSVTHSDYSRIERIMGSLGRELISVEDINYYKQQMGKPGAPTATANYYRALLQYPEASSMFNNGKVQAPTLFIQGTNDKYIGKQTLRGLEDVFEDVHLLQPRNCGHFVQQERPDLVNQAIHAFLRGEKLSVTEQ